MTMSMPPWELEWVPAGDDRDGLAVDADGGAEHRVVLEEVRRLNRCFLSEEKNMRGKAEESEEEEEAAWRHVRS